MKPPRPWRLIDRSLTCSVSNQKQQNLSTKAHSLLHSPTPQSYLELSQKFYEAMKACASLKSSPIARKLHAQVISSGLHSSIFIQNNLLHIYSSCGLIDDACGVFDETDCRNVFSWNTMINALAFAGRIREAERLFDEMPDRDSVSWNSMMSGYYYNGKYADAIKVFVLMFRSCSQYVPSLVSFRCALKACASLGYIKLALQLHGLVKKFDFGSKESIESSVMDVYIKCGVVTFAEKVFLRMPNPCLFCYNSMIYGYSRSYGVEKALDLFNKMSKRDSVSWNMLITILSQHEFGVETLHMFVEMCNQGFKPNSMTYASVLSACSSIYDLVWGSHLHARIIRIEQSLDAFVGSGLIDMYAKCSRLILARRVFDTLTEHNVVSWTSLIGGAAQHGLEEEALLLFNQMREIPVTLDDFALTTVLGICLGKKYYYLGRQLHAYTTKAGMDSSTAVENALATMYTNCGDVDAANSIFESMPMRDAISWTAMITAFAQIGDVEKARDCFNKTPERNVVTWNSMLSTYYQHGFWEEGLKLYCFMQKEGVKPNQVTFTISINACADLAIIKLGSQIVAQAQKLGFVSDVSVANSIVTMYSRCGHIEEAQCFFDFIHVKNLISWNAMMTGYAQNGEGKKVLEVFEEMQKLECWPDHISFVSILSGCSHSGLVIEGIHYFNSMTKVYGIPPTCKHFACMADLLGRSGLLELAKNWIDEMPIKPTADIWGALLCACRIHGNKKLAEIVIKNLIELDDKDSGSCILLANSYSVFGQFEGVADLRKLMREKGIRKNPGCSWIEVNNRVHVFTVDDTNHPQTEDIYRMLNVIFKRIQDTRNYIYDAGSKYYYTEKTAVVFG